MSMASFSVAFCGPALENGSMNVRELAPALLAFGALLEESNRVLNGGAASVSVHVKRFEDGSFGISFDVAQKLADQLVGLLSGSTITAASNLIQLLGFAGGAGASLWSLIKRASGRKPLKAKTLADGNVEIDFSEEMVVVPAKVFALYRDVKVRKELENALKPLEKDGVTSLEIKNDGQVIEGANKAETAWFRTPEIEDEKIEEDERTAVFSIHSLSFKDDNKWRLSDGTNTFYVTISDKAFLQKMNDNLAYFAKGDLLKVRLNVKTWAVADGIRTEYEAISILEHKSAAKQLSLPFE